MANVTLQGNIGKTPELRRTRDGTPVLGFSLADNRKDKDGKDLPPEWFEVSLWDGMAVLYEPVLEKGSFVQVVGRLQVDTYEGNDGVTRVNKRVMDPAVKFWPRREDGDRAGQGGSQPAEQPSQTQQQQQTATAQPRPAPAPRAQAFAGDDDPFGDQ